MTKDTNQDFIRAAHHEAGHMVIAAVMGLRLRPKGIGIDTRGAGVAFYCKQPEDSDLSRECIILATFAGFKAQTRFCEKNPSFKDYDMEDVIRSCDWCEARILSSGLSEAYFADEARAQIQTRLEERAKELVRQNWTAIAAVAAALLDNPWEPLKSGDEWSDDSVAKYMTGEAICSTLGRYGITALCEPAS